MKRLKLLALTLSGVLMLTSCGLLPEEETFRTAPVIKSYEKEEFEETVVVRGDMQLTNQISCTYIPMKTENLSFPVGGELFDEIFVEVGDTVKKGQLLAQLTLSGAEESIESSTEQIKKLNLQINALEENRKLEIERQKILLGDVPEDVLNESIEMTNKMFDMQKQPLADEMLIAQMLQKEAKALMNERQIYAGMDGIVTYVYEPKDEELCVSGDRIVTIADSTSSVFKADTKLWEHFVPGEEHTVIVDGAEYTTVVMSEAELGLEEVEKEEGKDYSVYLKPKNHAFDLRELAYGKVVLLLDSREDVLMVPESAVTTSKGQSIVYYQDESGLKAYKQIEIGLVADDMVEIVSGLSEGESIILK